MTMYEARCRSDHDAGVWGCIIISCVMRSSTSSQSPVGQALQPQSAIAAWHQEAELTLGCL